VILAHRIALDPTVEQRIAFARACGVARKAWNWGLNEWNRAYEAGEKTNANEIKKKWNKIKFVEFPWVRESPKDANQQPFANLSTAFQRFFKKKANHPDFKHKGEHDSFYVSNDKFKVDGLIVRLPVIGNVRMTEPLRLEGRITSGTISREAGRWFLSITVEMPDDIKPRSASGEVGIDLGVNTALMLSDGQAFQSPKPLTRYLRKLRRCSRSHSRKQKGSNNQKKSALRLARLHARIKNIRRDWTHKVTTKVCRENQTICLEDLNVKGMMANHCSARGISDISFHEIRRQFEYKAPMYGSKVVIINRWLPTSKACSNCGCKKDVLARKERTYTCDHCGFSLDRDLNAARNILAAGLAVSACGPESSGLARKSLTKLAGTKQELHREQTHVCSQRR